METVENKGKNAKEKKETRNEEKEDNLNNEVIAGPKFISINTINEIKKAVCKITIEKNEKKFHGTGFFLDYSRSKKLLMTCYHVIDPTLQNKIIEIEIYNGNKMELSLSDRYIKYFDKPKDITIIEIKESDEIYKEIKYLNYDLNFMKDGYSIYDEAYIFTIEYPYGGDASYSYGKILDIYNNEEFEHDIATVKGSSGCPIILPNDNIKLIRVIGIHKKGDKNNKINKGTFIGKFLNNELKYNFIISEININYDDKNKNIRIINSYEEYLRNGINRGILLKNENFNNEEAIKKCQIMVDDKFIPFQYFFKFESKGTHIIKYMFENNLKNLSLIFGDCESIINIDLYNFNIENFTNLKGMFYGCHSLKDINLSNFNTNTENVTDMKDMFYGCCSLTDINLSSFNTDNVTNMAKMFYGCSSLTDINLSNFNTKNVTIMEGMFYECKKLTNINLSKFNTNKVKNMGGMFYGCSSLSNIDLSNFKTDEVDIIAFMFFGCSSLTKINLSKFNTENVTDMRAMFYDCCSLTDINLSNFNTNNVTNVTSMFYNCSSLIKVDISNFNTKMVNNIGGMFYGCKNLKNDKIIIQDKRIFNYKEIYEKYDYSIIRKLK